MRQFKKINGIDNILANLYEFSDIFPHLMDKISDINTFASKLSDKAEVYVGIENESVFGLSAFYANDKITLCSYITLIGVKQEYRDRGLGKWLFEQTVEKSREKSMTQIKLEVDNDNVGAIAFYTKLGMKICGHTDRKSIYMNKEI